MLTDIIKITFSRLNKQGIPATPDMYQKYFCEEARKTGLFNAECNSINSLSNSLSYKNKQKLKKLDIETMDQLLDFLAVQLEGPGKQDSKEKNETQISPDAKNENLENLIGLVEIVKDALHPSVGNFYSEDIEIMNEKIMAHPELLSDKKIQDTIHNLVHGREDFDRRSIINKTIELTDITSDISKSLHKSIEINQNSNSKITQAKTQLKSFQTLDYEDEKKTTMIKNHFISISNTIESETIKLTTDLRNEHRQIKGISKKISNIRTNIEQVEEKDNLDFLTNTYTKAGFKEILEEIEERFDSNDEEYCLVLYDLDRLGKINKVYGFDAGDRVISVFAHLLNREFKENGAVSRYGGNKFLLAIYEHDLDRGIKYANGILDILQNVQFTYKNEKMKVTLSGAVCSRSNNNSQNLMIKNLQELLQSAKSNGRNRIEICSKRKK